MIDGVEQVCLADEAAARVEKELAGCYLALARVRADLQRANDAIARDGVMARMETIEGRPRASGMHTSATKMAKRLTATIAELLKEQEDMKPKDDPADEF
jgi:hypothetical protein